MSYMRKIRENETKEDKLNEEKKKKHRCYGCFWGRWDGNKVFCMFPKCIKGEWRE